MEKIQPLLQSLYGADSPYRWWCFALTFLFVLSCIKPTKPKAMPAFWVTLLLMAVIFGLKFVFQSNAPVDISETETGKAAKRQHASSFHSRFSNN